MHVDQSLCRIRKISDTVSLVMDQDVVELVISQLGMHSILQYSGSLTQFHGLYSTSTGSTLHSGKETQHSLMSHQHTLWDGFVITSGLTHHNLLTDTTRLG